MDAAGRSAFDDDDDGDGSEEKATASATARTTAQSPAATAALACLALPAPRMFLAADRSDVRVSLIRFTEGTILGVLRRNAVYRTIRAR
jgi:hypothetical protein